MTRARAELPRHGKGALSWPLIFSLALCGPMRYTPAMEEPTRDHGPQPLDGLMDQWNLTNHELVEVSTEQLNHKQVQKARKGRQLTLTLMQKIMRAFNIAIWTKRLDKEQKEAFTEYPHRQLFNYAKNHDPSWQDPNQSLMPVKSE